MKIKFLITYVIKIEKGVFMKKTRTILSIAVLFSAICIVGCASTLSTNVTRPAEISLGKVSSIAVGNFVYDNQNETTLQTKLLSELLNSGRFEKVGERKQLGSAAQAYIHGTVDKKADIENISTPYLDKEGKLKGTKYTQKVKVFCSVTFKVVNNETSEIMALKTISKTLEDSASAVNKGVEIDYEALYSKAEDNVIRDFMSLTTPKNVTVVINMISDKNLPENKVITDLMKSGQSDEAIHILQEATEQTYENNVSLANAYNNLGLVYVMTGEYDLGIQCIKKAISIKPSGKYKSNLEFANKEKQYALKYMEQTQ